MLTLDAAHGFLDLGSGSGVLAIAAAALGWNPVAAVDYDPASVEATRVNAARNGVIVDVQRLDLRRDRLPAFPTVAANLLAPLLIAWLARLGDGELPARVIAGGVLASEVDGVAAAFAARGFSESARRVGGEWAALLMDWPADQIHTEFQPS
jgi:ribosomal protein L11 methyltransferase